MASTASGRMKRRDTHTLLLHDPRGLMLTRRARELRERTHYAQYTSNELPRTTLPEKLQGHELAAMFAGSLER